MEISTSNVPLFPLELLGDNVLHTPHIAAHLVTDCIGEAVNLGITTLSGRNFADQSSANTIYARCSIHNLVLQSSRLDVGDGGVLFDNEAARHARPPYDHPPKIVPALSATLHEDEALWCDG